MTNDLQNFVADRKISKKKEDLEQWVAEHTADIPPLAEDLVTPYDGVSSQLVSA